MKFSLYPMWLGRTVVENGIDSHKSKQKLRLRLLLWIFVCGFICRFMFYFEFYFIFFSLLFHQSIPALARFPLKRVSEEQGDNWKRNGNERDPKNKKKRPLDGRLVVRKESLSIPPPSPWRFFWGKTECVQIQRQERFRTGLWSKAGVDCTPLINQSMTELSRKNGSMTKNVPEPVSTMSLFIVTLFWRRHCMGSGKKYLKISHFVLRHFSALSDLSCQFSSTA